MKPKSLVFGVGALSWGLVFSTAFAQAPDPSTSISSPGPVSEISVPRPIQSWETIDAPAGPVTLEPGPEATGPKPISTDTGSSAAAAGAAGALHGVVEMPPAIAPPPASPESQTESPAPRRRPVTVLGVDRTKFPEILVVFGLRDSEGNPVEDIVPAFLEIAEDEAPQKYYGLAPCVPGKLPGEPLTLMLLMDSSGSMQQYIDVVQNSAARFVERLREDDQAGVVGFCDSPVVIEELTTNKKHITRGIYSLQPRGFTALYDSVYLGARMLSGLPGKRAIVLVTDGKDDDGTGRQLSRRSLEQAIEAADQSNIPIFALGLGKDISQSTLRQMAEETGGEFLFAPNGQDVDQLYDEVARSLDRGDEGYYLARYRATQPDKDSSSRTVVVRYKNDSDRARYPAPRNLFWPLSKVIE